ncbi:hypothetical protein LGR54_21105 [Ancylobacter sp. Lp-2]|uniref:hypothetical protein n=1 Tax=Ancylobacter sp. Lp-2 TaxID=2881339 RepID=UPI001E626B44|nr:hypothetical protein [Ancylobacter sp. Lp-2]MCB4771113.1 hypothetical protein [Ancylobacter sp. Lp-2]
MLKVAIALALMAPMASAAVATTVRVARNDTPYSQEQILEGVRVFRAACQPLGGSQWDDLQSVEIDAMVEYAPHRLAKGWKYTIFVRAKVPDRPSAIPGARPDIGVIAGQTLHYALGGGRAPGFFSTKRASNYLCGIQGYDTSSDVFVPVPALGVLR